MFELRKSDNKEVRQKKLKSKDELKKELLTSLQEIDMYEKDELDQ